MTGAVKLTTPGSGSVIVQPASSIASDVTVNVPSQNCTLGIQGPAFSAYGSAGTSCNNGVATKQAINTKEFDTATCYDATTNYRFTPNVAGYYQITGYVSCGGTTGCYVALFKNGSEAKRGNQTESSAAAVGYCVDGLIQFNGTTDYVELFFYNGSGSTKTTNGGSSLSYFQAALMRAT